MALIECKECGATVSDSAKACPTCGNPSPQGNGWMPAIVMGIAGFFIIGSLLMSFVASEKNPSAQDDQAASAEKMASDKRVRMALAAAKTVKDSLRDPDSVRWEKLMVNDNATVACVIYRARNGFGGMNLDHAVLTLTRSSQSPTDWNRYCVNKSLHDMTYVRHSMK